MTRKDLKISQTEWRSTKNTHATPLAPSQQSTWKGTMLKTLWRVAITTVIAAFWYFLILGATP